jgi:hypothetical protein
MLGDYRLQISIAALNGGEQVFRGTVGLEGKQHSNFCLFSNHVFCFLSGCPERPERR